MEQEKLFHEVVAEKLIEQLKTGTAPWQKPIEQGASYSVLPMNPKTGNRYNGINALHLMAQGYKDSRWMTSKQAGSIGAQVREGETGTLIQYWKLSEEQEKLDEKGNPLLDHKGRRVKERVQFERPQFFFATVFNGEQIEGLPPLQPKTEPEPMISRAEALLKASGATLTHHDNKDNTFYHPDIDTIYLPHKSLFPNETHYYAAALHELGHWTGHPSRLNRDLSHPFGSEGYAQENLRAEIFSLILGDTLGIGHTPQQNPVYIKAWIKRLEEDPLEIFRAATDAEKIHELLLALEQKHIQEQSQANNDGNPLEPLKANIHAQNQNDEQVPEGYYITVPFKENKEAKSLGARWDRQQQSWYVPEGIDKAPFEKWAPGPSTVVMETVTKTQKAQSQDSKTTEKRVYLAVPYGEKNAAQAAGAKWDKAAKSWYIGPQGDQEKLERWKPRNMPQQGPAMRPREEFAEALRSLGCEVRGEHPIMDGKKHRIQVEGDKNKETSGSYRVYLNKNPSGYIENYRTKQKMEWKAKGYSLSPQEQERLKAEAAARSAESKAEKNLLQEKTAQRVAQQMKTLLPIVEPTPYMKSKELQIYSGVLTDNEGKTTYVPVFDVEGKQWSIQSIQENGTKRFTTDSRKKGCFHPVGGMDALRSASALIIAEGYATALSIHEALGKPTVAAFDAGNLLPVAEALREKFPEKPILIAGDDDRHLEKTQGINPGRSKAEEASKAVGGKATFPSFSSGEQTENPENFTDFNDLAAKSKLGKEGIQRQVGGALSKLIQDENERQKVEKIEQKQQRQPRAKKIA